MSEEEYNSKLKSVQRFIPFLENMIDQLKDPRMKNREQQLKKMESLHGMITDKKKKLKVETLIKCEEVILKLYQKVKGEHASCPASPPDRSKDDKRKATDIYSVAGESLNRRKNYDDFDILPSSSKGDKPKSFFLRKPPISYADLEVLKKDVASELESKMSLQELNSLRNELFQQLEETKAEQINTTVRNKPVLMKMNVSPDKVKKSSDRSNSFSRRSSDEKKEHTSVPSKRRDNSRSPKVYTPKVLKESDDIFGSAFSEIDKTYEKEAKRKEDRRFSAEGEKKEKDDQGLADKISQIKKLAEKAAELRNKISPKIVLNTGTTKEDKVVSETDQTLMPNSMNSPSPGNAAPKGIFNASMKSVENIDNFLPEVSDSIIKQAIEIVLCPSKRDSPKPELKQESSPKAEPPKTLEETHIAPIQKEDVSTDVEPSKDETFSTDGIKDIIPLKKESSKSDATKVTTPPKKESSKVPDSKVDDSKDKGNKEKSKSHKDSKNDKHSKDKKHGDHKKDHKSDHKREHTSDHKKDDKAKEKRHDKEKKERVNENEKNVEKKKKDHEKVKKDKVKDSEPTEIGKKDEIIVEKPKEAIKEIKPVSRDPRLKFGANAASNKAVPPVPIKSVTDNVTPLISNNIASAETKDCTNRLAYKYNPKPKKQDSELDLERNVADSIEKSMKDSFIPLPPRAQLAAPPIPPVDLFSPQSPEDVDKAPMPTIFNNILLNPKTTGVINEVVTALKRSNESNLITVVGAATARKNEIGNSVLPRDPNLGLLNQFKPTPESHFSPPSFPMKLAPSPSDSSIFVPPKPVPPPVINNAQPRGFNPFHQMEQNNDAMPVLDFQPAMNTVQNFDIPSNPPHLTPYEDRMGQQGFHMDRGMNFVPPSPSYVPPSPSYVPPSPSYVPPSPLYDGGNDNFRDMQMTNFHKYPMDRTPHSQGYFDQDRGVMTRPKSLLGDYPVNMPFKTQFGHQNYDNFYNNPGVASSGFMDQRKPFFPSATRDPRIQTKRGIQFPGNDPRMAFKDSRMTYRDYKEQRDRENREREMREREIRERELREKELLERQRRELEEADVRERQAKEKEALEKEDRNKEKIDGRKERDRDKGGTRPRDRSRDRGRSRDRSQDEFSRNHSSSRYRRDNDDRSDRSKERHRFGESRFDKVYSSRDKDKEDFTSPLDSLYTSSQAKTGKGYGVQFKIPKKVKEEDKPKKEESKPKMEEDELKMEEDKPKKIKDLQKMEELGSENKGDDLDKPEADKKDLENKKLEEEVETIKDEGKEEKTISNDALKRKEGKEKEKTRDLGEDSDSIDVKIKVEDSLADDDDVVEIKKEVPVVVVKDHSDDRPKEKETTVGDVDHINETEDLKKCQEPNVKKNEEESILSKFFGNLMKSSNKDEKKGALLSLISTFSDSFSDQQLKRITSIIKCDEDEEDKHEEISQKDEVPKVHEEKIDQENTCHNEDEAEVEKVVEEVSVEMEEKHDELAEDVQKDLNPEDSLVQVSVGERIKNRKRSDLKSKVKLKTELDRLHEDIREMFIRDGVVTATGKRMCRILKDNTNEPLLTENEKTEDEITQEEVKKSGVIKKKPGRKVGWRKSKATPDMEMRELSVILPKMSFDNMKEAEENSDKRYSLRKQAKTTNYNENDAEEYKSREIEKEKNIDEAGINEEIREEEDEAKNEDEKNTSVDEPKKIRARKKMRNSWATGVIKKKSSGKSKKISPSRGDVAETANTKEDDSEKPLPNKGEPLHLHDKNYYFRLEQKNLPCKVCDVSTKWIAAHYRSEHPDIEVLSSRLPPDVAEIAIADAIANKEEYEQDVEVSKNKQHYTCIFCDYGQITVPRMYRDHVSIHTGEFRHKCPYCNYRRSHIKSVQTHLAEAHTAQETISKRRIVSQAATEFVNVYAYLCEVCNYTQMNLQHVQDHIKIYHSGTRKCKIHKIKVNWSGEKPKENLTSQETDCKKASPVKERPTRRSAKIAQSQKKEEDTAPEMDLEMTNSTEKYEEERSDRGKLDSSPPKLTREVEEPLRTTPSTDKSEEITEDSESQNTSIDETVVKRTRKRRKSFVKPGPARRKQRRQSAKSVISNTDTEQDSDDRSSPRKTASDKAEEIVTKKIDEAVFTCNTDIHEENKLIEEERMKKMQDINSTIKLRTSLEFVEKLSHRLKKEEQEEVIVKQEPQDPEESTFANVPPNELPVFEKSHQKRDVEPVLVRQDSSPKTCKDGGKVNPISGVIEKLQGILSNPPPSGDVDDEQGPPPLKHKNQIERKVEREMNSEVLNIGPIKIIKSADTYIYACCSPPCIFSSRDQHVFMSHCRYDHEWNENMDKFPCCCECGVTLECSEDDPLLIVALNHALKSHSSFVGVRVGSIRISSNLFPDNKPVVTDVEEKHDAVSFDSAISTPPTISIPSPPGIETSDEVDPLMSASIIPENNEDENPFSFKIVDVVSLADDAMPPLSFIGDQPDDGDNVAKEADTDVPALNMISPQNQKKKIIISPSKKSSNALKKFLNAHNDLFKCPEFSCLFTTNRRKMFDIHIMMHPQQSSRSLSCLYCDKIVSLEAMGDHYEQVHGMCRFSCFYCLYRCIVKDYMDIHQLLAHPKSPLRMQLLPKRDSEDKKLISILSEATKSTPVPPYKCFNEQFVYYQQFVSYIEKCNLPNRYTCQFSDGNVECGKQLNNVDELGKHWGEAHGVYPLKCAYCDQGSFDISEMMIHMVFQHPTLPPDVIDRSTVPKNKNQTCPSRAQCNFKQLVSDLRSDPAKAKLHENLQNINLNEHSPRPSATRSPLPQTMQKAFENFVNSNNQGGVLNKAVSTYSKVTPVNLVPASGGNISVLKQTTKSNVLASGGVVYCLAPTSSKQNQLVKAIVVNKDSATGVPQEVRLLSPVSMPPVDGKFQMLKTVHKMIPINSKVPKLTPIASLPGRLVPLPPVQPIVLSGIGESGAASTEESQGLDGVSPVKSNEDRSAMGGNIEDGGDKDQLTSEENNVDLSMDEPMMVIDEDFGSKSPSHAVDPLSLDMDDPLTSHSPKTNENMPYSGVTPVHEYDSDSKDLEPQDATLQKTGLIGYQLYRCAKCDLSFSEHSKFKDHLIKSTQCKFDNAANKPYKCVHCAKFLKHYSNLLDHLGYHGHLRFLCSLCSKKYPHGNQVKYHMKTQHNVLNIVMQPLIQHKNNLNYDEFVVKPQAVGSMKTPMKDGAGEGDPQKLGDVKTIFYSHEADDIPQKSILSYDITCGHCKKFKNKVRSNIVRHLLLHKNDQEFTVPDTAPVNPVPCLEKNEKMFDKMYNLASSSHVGGRMGGQQKGDTKSMDNIAEDNYPAFVPSNKRFQCCAVGCNYLCLEEGNLRHHLTALHMEDLNFVCVHCKKDLSDAVDVDTILKHLKLHELHLYKCSVCDFMHNLKHKIERHIGEKHKNKDSTVVVIRAMDSEPYDENQQVHAPFPVVMNQKSMKPWRCCMCKYRCYTQDEVEAHAKNKHDIDCRYKCALCTFKSNEMPEFNGHFKDTHPDNDIDIILVYHKEDEAHEASSEQDQFDTTPLWLRDKPRVRHIRGILFEENSPVKKKGAPLKTAGVEQAANGSAAPAKKRKRSSSTFTESPRVPEEELDLKRESEETTAKPDTKNSDVIVIDDEDEESQPSLQAEPSSLQEYDDIDLLCTYGDVGMPLNKHFKCPKCDKYRSTKMREFIQHVAKEMNYYRFTCSICEEKFVTLEAIKMHCIDFHDCSIKSIVPLPVDNGLNRWLTILLEKQRTIIRSLGFATEELPTSVEDFLGSHETTYPNKSTTPKEPTQKPIKCKECGFSVSGPQAMDRHLKYNHPYLAFKPSSSPQPAAPSPLLAEDVKAGTSATVSKKRPSDGVAENAPEVKRSRMIHLIAKDKYVCNLCNMAFDSVPEMEFHGTDKHGGEITYVIQTTELPMTYEYGRNIYRCWYCPTTGTKFSLEMHCHQDHPGQKFNVYRFACGVCPAKFEMIKSFRQHFKNHDLAVVFYFDVHDKKVTLRTRTPNNNAKNKLYRCPVCPYVSHSTSAANMKTHLKIHARPYSCELCQSLFKNRPDARSHHLKEHPHNIETIVELPEMIQKINTLMEEVMRTMERVDMVEKTAEAELVEVESDLPELVMDPEANEEAMTEEAAEQTRHFAKKSTSSLAKRDETREYYSFYGQKPEVVDMKKILTTFEIADAKIRMTCDQLSRIYNLKPIVTLKDCMTLIIEEDDDLSS